MLHEGQKKLVRNEEKRKGMVGGLLFRLRVKGRFNESFASHYSD